MPAPRRLFQRAMILIGAAALVGGGAALVILKPWETPPVSQVTRIDAEIELAAGEVLLETATGSARLLSHTPVPAGAKVRTGEGARALIRLSDGSRAFLDAQTIVTIGDGLTIEQGRVWLDAPALERGAEPTVHALGTDVRVSLAEGGASLRADAEETIVDGAAGRREVAAGERALLDASGAPSVEPVAFW
jgi:Ca-activated chloride channel family protein